MCCNADLNSVIQLIKDKCRGVVAFDNDVIRVFWGEDVYLLYGAICMLR